MINDDQSSFEVETCVVYLPWKFLCVSALSPLLVLSLVLVHYSFVKLVNEGLFVLYLCSVYTTV